MAVIPTKYDDLLTDKVAFANLATVLKDGTPQVTPIWFEYADGKFKLNTAKGRVKARTLKPGAVIAMAIAEPANPYRYVQVRGRVTEVTEKGAREHIDKLSQKYLGKPYPHSQPGEVRVMAMVEPFSAQGNG
ncbi:MAG TPA: TIGR03618 family F420-dependent PPOX class oxidoreductase [Candidatus Binataceae bacterium]|nr:TIGR03618 family F420-dependent PPOX class oxidoreductase [Candidatus Binataceae bacterium]HVB81695.1 TIGR03618 family F420-dependent PPOX class oxidoreductase [Candidatus Binataceae bacterium]